MESVARPCSSRFLPLTSRPPPLGTSRRKVIKRPVYIAGNSLGGFLSVGLAALHGEWVRGCILLNPTPFWAFLPNRKLLPSWVLSMIPWDGTLPAPDHLAKIGAAYFDQLRNRETVASMLQAVYANSRAFDDDLVENILAPTRNPHGHEAFASILFAPKPEVRGATTRCRPRI